MKKHTQYVARALPFAFAAIAAGCGGAEPQSTAVVTSSVLSMGEFDRCGVYWDYSRAAFIGTLAVDANVPVDLQEVTITIGETEYVIPGGPFVLIDDTDQQEQHLYVPFENVDSNVLDALKDELATVKVTTENGDITGCTAKPANGSILLSYDACPNCLRRYMCWCMEGLYQHTPAVSWCDGPIAQRGLCLSL